MVVFIPSAGFHVHTGIQCIPTTPPQHAGAAPTPHTRTGFGGTYTYLSSLASTPFYPPPRTLYSLLLCFNFLPPTHRVCDILVSGHGVAPACLEQTWMFGLGQDGTGLNNTPILDFGKGISPLLLPIIFFFYQAFLPSTYIPFVIFCLELTRRRSSPTCACMASVGPCCTISISFLSPFGIYQRSCQRPTTVCCVGRRRKDTMQRILGSHVCVCLPLNRHFILLPILNFTANILPSLSWLEKKRGRTWHGRAYLAQILCAMARVMLRGGDDSGTHMLCCGAAYDGRALCWTFTTPAEPLVPGCAGTTFQ